MAKRTAPRISFGFTLIELLVSLVVISILFGVGYANFRRYAQRQELWRAARQIEGDLRLAQSYALAGKDAKKEDGSNLCDSGTYFYGYRFYGDRFGLPKYGFNPVCRDSNGAVSNKEPNYVKSLEPSTEFTLSFSSSPFYFLAVTGGIDNDNVTIEVKRKDITNSDKITITVNSTGKIEMAASFQ